MSSVRRLLRGLFASILGIVVVGLVAIVLFAVTVFVIATGAELAGYEPSADFLVLSAALIVVSVILTGGFTPRLSSRGSDDEGEEGFEDRTFN